MTGFPVRPGTEAVTVFMPAEVPRVRITDACPCTFVFTTWAEREPPPAATTKVTGVLGIGPPAPTTVTTNGFAKGEPAAPT